MWTLIYLVLWTYANMQNLFIIFIEIKGKTMWIKDDWIRKKNLYLKYYSHGDKIKHLKFRIQWLCNCGNCMVTQWLWLWVIHMRWKRTFICKTELLIVPSIICHTPDFSNSKLQMLVFKIRLTIRLCSYCIVSLVLDLSNQP